MNLCSLDIEMFDENIHCLFDNVNAVGEDP